MNLNEFSQLSSDLKKDFIDKLLSQCKPNDLHYLEAKLNEFKRDFLTYLPSEITHLILDYLDWKDLLNCCQVSSNWNKIISNNINEIWKKWCIKERLIQNQNQDETNYKEAYLHLKRKESSIESGNEFKQLSVDIGPAEMNAIACYKNIIATNDSQLSKWSQFNQLSLETSVSDFKFNNQYLVCVSYFFTIYVYSLSLNELICILVGHTAKITSFDFNSNLVVSCSADRTIRLWSLSSYSLIQTNTIEEYPIKVSILESNNLNLILTITSQGVLYVQHFNTNLTFSGLEVLNSTDFDFEYIELSDKTYFNLIDNQLTGYFVINNNSKKENKLFVEIFLWNQKLNKFVFSSFENNEYFDYLNQYRLDNNNKYEIVKFGLKYCLFVDQNDDIYLTNLKTKSINLIVNSKDNLNKKGTFEYSNSQIGRKSNFKFNNSLDWLNSLNEFYTRQGQIENETVLVFHGQNMKELFTLVWKNQ